MSMLRESITQNESSQHEKSLPFKEEKPQLANNKACEIHHLRWLEKKDQERIKDTTRTM